MYSPPPGPPPCIPGALEVCDCIKYPGLGDVGHFHGQISTVMPRTPLSEQLPSGSLFSGVQPNTGQLGVRLPSFLVSFLIFNRSLVPNYPPSSVATDTGVDGIPKPMRGLIQHIEDFGHLSKTHQKHLRSNIALMEKSTPTELGSASISRHKTTKPF